MMLLLPLLFILPLLTGFLLVRLLLPSRPKGMGRLWLHLSLGWGLGTGIFSILSFYWLLLFKAWDQKLLLLELGILLAVLFCVRIAGKAKDIALSAPLPHPLAENNPSRLPGLLFIIFFVYAGIMFFFLLYANPHGRWDAWYIWNLRARFLFRGQVNWMEAFSPLLSHTDYPPLLPLTVARYWFQIKRETLLVPGLISLFYMLSTAGLLVSAFSLNRTRIKGYLAGIFLLGTPFFLFLAADQIADNPLAYYFLGVLVCFFLYDQKVNSEPGLIILAGILAGFSGWTKNEGLLFLLTLPLARLFVPRQTWKAYGRIMGFYLLGLLPVLLTILIFKVHIAPANDLWGPQTVITLFQKLGEGGRYLQIGKDFIKTFYEFGYWPSLKLNALLFIFAVLFGFSWSRLWRDLLPSTLVFVVMLAGYFSVFVLSPHDLSWHLRTATDRLFLHFWPSLLFIYFLLLRPPDSTS
ncbi:MAG: hypothetical protein AB1585_21480 [Thermodesulfobacteriota bacterium]